MLHRRHLDGTFVVAKKGACVLERPSGARVRRSWQLQTALLFSSLPLAIHIESASPLESASPHEVTLVQPTLQASHVSGTPARLVGDKAYDSDPLDAELMELGIDMIAPQLLPNCSPIAPQLLPTGVTVRSLRPRTVGSCGGTSEGGRSNASLPGLVTSEKWLFGMSVILRTSLPL
jgi:hypothetical protein